MITWRPFSAVVTAALAILVGLWLTFQHNQELAESKAETMYYVAVAKAVLHYADSVSAQAAVTAAHATAIEHERQIKAPARAKIVAQAPDTCKPAIAALTADRDEARESAAGWKQSYEKQVAATQALQPATEHLVDASTNLAKHSGESFLQRITPDLGFGAAAGISAVDRRPDAVIGVTLSWRF